MSEALRLLAGAPEIGGSLVTHVFPLDEYARAVVVATGRAHHRAVKVALAP